MNRILFILGCISTLVVAACADEPVVVMRWEKAGGTYEGFIQVRGSCINDVNKETRPFFVAGVRDPGKRSGLAELIVDIESDVGVRDPALSDFDNELFRRCMNDHGWHITPNGFAPPDGDEVAMGR